MSDFRRDIAQSILMKMSCFSGTKTGATCCLGKEVRPTLNRAFHEKTASEIWNARNYLPRRIGRRRHGNPVFSRPELGPFGNF